MIIKEKDIDRGFDGLRNVWGDDLPFYVEKQGEVKASEAIVPVVTPAVKPALEAIVPVAAPVIEPSEEAVTPVVGGRRAREEKRYLLKELYNQVRHCQKCELHRTRNKTVFGAGNVDASLVFVGEAPGVDEDKQGLPFVGRSGELLTKMIEGGMGFRRQDVFILNVLRCRPPGNRVPLPVEIESCRGYLEKTLEIIGPELIVALGRSASQALLKCERSLGSLRGGTYDYHGVPLIATYHPAFLLRNSADKRLAWQDLKRALKLLSLPMPKNK